MDVEAEPGPRLQAARQQQLGAREVGGLGDLEVGLVAGDRGDHQAGSLGDGDVVGELGAGGRPVGCEDRVIGKTLRRLRAVQTGALDGPQHPALRNPLQGVGHRQGGQHRRVARQAVEHPVDQRRIDQRPDAVVDQDHPRRRRGQALEPEPDRILPARTARDRRQQIEAARRLLIEPAVVGMDHGAHGGDPGVAAKALETVPEHRSTGERLVLLRPLGAEPLAPTRGHDQGHAPGQGALSFALGPAPRAGWTQARRAAPLCQARPSVARDACRSGRNRLSSARVLGNFAW